MDWNPDHPDGSSEPTSGQASRRDFLIGAGRTAKYAAPLILSLTIATQRVCASEAGPAPSCTPSGSKCEQDSDCCSNRCDSGGTDNCLPPL